MTKTSSPRTFSWISTKISMSANRRTLALGERKVQRLGNGLGERPIAVAGDDLQRAG